MSRDVLIVDDDTKLTAMLKSYLEDQGYDVRVADGGIAGAQDALREPTDIVLLDVMLPDIDGFETCRRIREQSNVPIIMLTARGEDTDRIVGLEIGADDYVPKPFNPRELAARMKAVLRRAVREAPRDGSESGEFIRIGDLVFDFEGRRLTKNDTPLELTSRQFDLLRILVERKGRVQSRSALMKELTGDEFDSFDRSIDVHVSRIRAAIEDNPKKPKYLKSVRGAGYVFAAPQDVDTDPVPE